MSLSSLLISFPPLWAQTGPPRALNALLWLYVWGDPAVTIQGPLGGIMTWIKVVGLFSLLGWAGSWVLSALKNRRPSGGLTQHPAIDLAALGGVGLGLLSAFTWVLLSNKRIPANLAWLPTLLGVLSSLILLVWIEVRLFSVLIPRGDRADRAVLVGLHLALLAGFAVGFALRRSGAMGPAATARDALFVGGRLGATFMGFAVLIRLLTLLLPEIRAVRFRRLYAIGWQCWTEAFRRMAAPWVVLILFVVILAFANWFLQTPRLAELGRLYVYALMLLTSLLLSLLVVILTPISLPYDIRQQTIFTVVSKPVRRLEMIWGRILGYQALVTLLIVIFGLVSLAYYDNQIWAAIGAVDAKAQAAAKENKTEFARQFREQADQLRTRMAARLPVYGSLLYFDSRGHERRHGIDVGIELPTRSFIEGATPSRAIWRFGPAIPNPRNPGEMLDRTIPVTDMLHPGTIEWVENQAFEAADRVAAAQRATSGAPNLRASDVRRLAAEGTEAQAEYKRLQAQVDNLRQQEQSLRKEGKAAQANRLHSPGIPIEMTFNVYRTTKGEVGEPVAAQISVVNPRPEIGTQRFVLKIREYYTNRQVIPARLLVGSRGALNIEVQCTTVNQYLGMAEGDLFLLASQGRFETNFLRGLFGIWLQAMVLTAIGVCAGTFLSWPVALLMTFFFFIAGNFGFTALQKFALAAELVGGGPFESLIRMLSHDNMMSDLAPTTAVVTAKTLDSIVMPVMARLVYLVPNFTALDVSNIVADGFAVTWRTLLGQLLLAVAYALPFSIAGYFILRNREVAA